VASLVLDLRYGEPPYGQSTELFVRGLQASLGGEGLWRQKPLPRWVKPYVALGLGWREERLLGAGDRTGRDSAPASRAILQGDLGLSCDAAGDGHRWQLLLRLGVTGTLPFGSETVSLGGESFELLSPSAGALVAVELVFDPR
jgi:hypothetical protein